MWTDLYEAFTLLRGWAYDFQTKECCFGVEGCRIGKLRGGWGWGILRGCWFRRWSLRTWVPNMERCRWLVEGVGVHHPYFNAWPTDTEGITEAAGASAYQRIGRLTMVADPMDPLTMKPNSTIPLPDVVVQGLPLLTNGQWQEIILI